MAGIRTYIPGIIALVKLACRFMDRYDAQLRENIPEAQLPIYEALHDACDAFEAIIPLIQPAIGD
jgi:hypothetical protein